jgi:hypothetical protein
MRAFDNYNLGAFSWNTAGAALQAYREDATYDPIWRMVRRGLRGTSRRKW